MPLSPDFSRAVGEPRLLFHASEAPWTSPIDEYGSLVTDGPFLYCARNGDLLMLWASFIDDRYYAEGVARPLSGTLVGPWQHEIAPFYAEDGGHGMLFRSFMRA